MITNNSGDCADIGDIAFYVIDLALFKKKVWNNPYKKNYKGGHAN